MAFPEHIMVAVELPDPPPHLCEVVSQLAVQSDADITVFHAVATEEYDAFPEIRPRTSLEAAGLSHAQATEIERQLQRICDERFPGLRARPLAVSQEDPAEAIRRFAGVEHADLIVLGSRHVEPEETHDVGQQLIDDPPCPVLIVPRHRD